MPETSKMTAAAHEALRAKIDELEGAGRRAMAERIGTAREWGDLKENAEYHAAKEDAAMLEAKIARLRAQLAGAEIVADAEAGEGAGMHSTVTYNDRADGREMRFTLVPAPEARPSDGLLSIDSPVGRVLSGARAGDVRTLTTPAGERSIEISAVEHA